MVTYSCVEPASESPVAKRVVWARATDDIVFPSVDSCLAIGVVLADGNMIGGHVAEFDDITHQPEINLQRTVASMKALCGPQDVALLVTLGDATWKVDALKGTFGARRHVRYTKGNGAYYMMLDGRSRRIVVQKGFKGAPLGLGEPFAGKSDLKKTL